MARRGEHSQEQIKEMILNAAEVIIHRNGVEALTVRKVALEIGYTIGSVYMVFANMQDLLMHIKSRALDQLDAHFRETTADDDIEQQIRSFAGSYISFAAANFNRWNLIFSPVGRNNEALPDGYQEKIERMFAPLEALFRQLKPESSPEQARLATRTLWCGVHGVCVLMLTGHLGRAGMDNAEFAISLMVDNFIQGWKE